MRVRPSWMVVCCTEENIWYPGGYSHLICGAFTTLIHTRSHTICTRHYQRRLHPISCPSHRDLRPPFFSLRSALIRSRCSEHPARYRFLRTIAIISVYILVWIHSTHSRNPRSKSELVCLRMIFVEDSTERAAPLVIPCLLMAGFCNCRNWNTFGLWNTFGTAFNSFAGLLSNTFGCST